MRCSRPIFFGVGEKREKGSKRTKKEIKGNLKKYTKFYYPGRKSKQIQGGKIKHHPNYIHPCSKRQMHHFSLTYSAHFGHFRIINSGQFSNILVTTTTLMMIGSLATCHHGPCASPSMHGWGAPQGFPRAGGAQRKHCGHPQPCWS